MDVPHRAHHYVPMIRRILLALALLLASPATAAPGEVRVSLKTSEGTILLALDTRRAPITANNFLAYVDRKYFDGTRFYRAARALGNPRQGFIQGGIKRDLRRSMPPIAHEPTTKTGLSHRDGTISMAMREPGTAMGEFFIMVGAARSMDAKGNGKGANAGFAAFGRVVSGMPVVKRILAARTHPGGGGALKGQMIKEPVMIIEARRVK